MTMKPALVKPTLVLEPGLGNNARIWAEQVTQFSADHDLVIPDYSAATSIDEMADSVLQQVTAEYFSLLGYSLGGYIALNLTQRIPQRIERLAFVSSSPYADSDQTLKQRKAIIRSAIEDYRLTLENLGKTIIHPNANNAESARNILNLMGQEIGVDVFCQHQKAIMQRSDCRSALGSIECPVAVLVGENDVVTPLSANRFLADNIKGASLQVIDQAGHLLPLEKPEEVTGFIRQWLKLDV